MKDTEIKAMISPFDSIKTIDVSGNEWWNSRSLANVLLYRTSAGSVQIEVVFNGDTFWLSQKRMSQLFGVDVSTINYHLHNIDESGEVHLSEAVRKIPNVLDYSITDIPIFCNNVSIPTKGRG